MALCIRTMTAHDLSLGMRLKRNAGWNQTEQDWQRFLTLGGAGCFVAELDGRPVGTTTTCIFPDGVGWIAMLLVDPDARGRGVGSALLKHAIDHLDAHSVTSVRLDATPMGRPIYEKLGFVDQFDLVRYEGAPDPPPARHHPTVQAASRDDWAQVIALDRQVNATDRAALLRALFEAHPQALRLARDGGEVVGYITDRPGENAHMLGPAAALSSEAGDALLLDALHRHAGRNVHIDIPVANGPATELAELAGLTIQRPLHRMTRGQPLCENVQHLWASSGPEMG